MSQRQVVVTGHTGLLGRAVVCSLVQDGWQVIGVSRQHQSSDEKADGPEIVVRSDLTDEGAAEQLCVQLRERDLTPSALVHAARDPRHLGDEFSSRDRWLGEYLLDVVVAHELVAAFHAAFPDTFGAAVVVGSQYGSVAVDPRLYAESGVAPTPVHYATAKAAQEQLVRQLAVDLGPDVRVNAVTPGGLESARVDDGFRKAYARRLPAGRMIEPQEAADAVAYLLDDRASGITGHVLAVNGGWGLA